MKKCPFCGKEMEQVTPAAALEALGVDMEGALGAMLGKALNPRGRVFRCIGCRFIAIFA